MTDVSQAARTDKSVQLQDEDLDPTLVALSTLSLLNLRLSRVESALTGRAAPSTEDCRSSKDSASPPDNVPAQLRQLESRLTNLKRLDGLPGSLVRMIDSLRREHPEVFSATGQTQDLESETPPDVRNISLQATQVLSHAPLYTSTSSRLQTLQTLQIPPAAHSASLMNAKSRLDQLRARQEKLDSEVLDLTDRSARAAEWWISNGVVGMGELFEDWDERLQDMGRVVRRQERRRAQELGITT